MKSKIIPLLCIFILFGCQKNDIEVYNGKNTSIEKLKDLDHKISLINKNDPDYLDILYRQKLNYVTKDEIIIKLR